MSGFIGRSPKEQKSYAREFLIKRIERDMTIYTVRRHSTGTKHVFAILLITDAKIDGKNIPQIENISPWVAKLLGEKWDDKRDGVWASVATEIVQRMSYALHGTEILRAGFTLKHKAI